MGGLVLQSRPSVLKTRTNLSGHMYGDRKEKRERSNVTTATAACPEELGIQACGGGTGFGGLGVLPAVQTLEISAGIYVLARKPSRGSHPAFAVTFRLY